MEMLTMLPQPDVEMEIVKIPIDELHADELFNCRGEIAPIDVTDLCKSMAQHGLQLPIEIQPYDEAHQKLTGKKYRVVCGHRRLKAASLLQWTMISAIVKNGLTESEARIRNLTENLIREDLNILQEAKALANLKAAGVTQEQASSELNKSRGWIQVRFMLLELNAEIQREASLNLLNQEQIRDLYTLRHDVDSQATLVRTIKEARERGEKIPSKNKKEKVKTPLAKMHRKREDLFEMIEHIGKSVGMNFGTRCLAWAAGEINDIELYQEIAEVAKGMGRHYEVPTQAVSEMSGGSYANSEWT